MKEVCSAVEGLQEGALQTGSLGVAFGVIGGLCVALGVIIRIEKLESGSLNLSGEC